MQLVCREVSTLSPGSWTVVISGNGQDKIIDLHGPFDSESEALIQWYLEDFADSPFTNYRANAAVAAIENYTTALWGQLQIDTPERILLSESSTTALGIPPSVQVTESSLRVLVVSARSKTKADLDPRLTSLPLVQTVAGDPRVQLEFVHTGTFEEFQRVLDHRPASQNIHLVHFDLHGVIDREKGPVLEFFDAKTNHRKGHTAPSVAKVLQRNGVQWAVLCACRTAKISSTFCHLALEFLNHGVTGVFAMRYELKAAAAKILTSSFYLALCRDGKSFLEAGHASRRALQNNQLRLARFGEKVNIQDFMIPVVYSFEGRDFCLAKDKESPCVFTTAPENLPELIGREDDISQVSSILTDKSFVLLTADIGNGKSILMRHLAWWWKQTKMFTQTAYVNVSLAETEFDTSRSIGILAVAKGIWRSVHGRDAPLSVHSDPKRYLFEAMDAAKGQGLIVLLDGINRVYQTSSSSDDTSQEWVEFFHVAKLLSITGFKLLVATCKKSLIASCDADANLFDLSVSMSTEDAWKLASPDPKLGTLQSNTLNHLQSPDTHLSCTLEVLKYNRAVLQSVSGSFKDRFHGLETILSWDEPFHEEITEASYLDLFTNTSTGALSLNMNDNQGLDRTHHLMIIIFKHLAQSNRWADMCALISIGLWTDVMPHPEEIVGIFENADISTQIPSLRYIVDSISIMQLQTSLLPFELWYIMKKSPVRRGNFSFSSKTDIVESLKYAVQFLSAAQLITGQTAPLVDGKQGYQLHPALTTWLRRILRAVPHDVILVNFVTCMEERASRMGDVNPNVHDLRSGDAELLRAVELPSFNFVEKEKWNIISAIVALSQKVDKMSSMGIELPPDTRRFAWMSFLALAPITETRDDFCTWFLTHVALKSIKRLATLVPESHITPLPSALTHFLLLGILNWVIWMAQKYRLEDRLAHPLRVRRLLLARVQAIRDSGIACDELLDQDFVLVETQAWLNEGWIALASSDKEKGQETFQKIREKAATTLQGAKEAWDVRLTLLDHAMGGSSLTDTDSLQHRKVAPYTGVQDANSLPDHAVMRSFAMDQFRRCILSPTKNRDDPTINGWIMGILTFMETDLDFMSTIRPWYIQKVIPIFTHLRNGNIPRAIKASLNGLSIAERDGDTLLASNFRQLSRRLADLDTIDEYDIQQTNLARTAENSVPIVQDLLTIYLAKHDTPGAYEHVKNKRGELRADGIMFSALHEAMQCVTGNCLGSLWDNGPKTDAFFQIGLEGWDQLLVLLEPYKDAKLEDKQEWVCLMKEIWKLMDEVFDRNTPEDQAWMQDLYKTHPEPKKARGLWSDQGVSNHGSGGEGHLKKD